MANLPDGVQVIFDNVEIETSDASSAVATTNDSLPRDYHKENYPSYVPPHKRGHNVQQDKFVNFKSNKQGELDKVEGVDNEKYQKLICQVPFALERDKLAKLKVDFPGVYFHCRDNGNHDHAFSHVVTMLGTRFLQRRIRPGSRILDVYGNPNACDSFNRSQVNATEPKSMKALVNRYGPEDFIREVNKWGPFFDNEAGVERYHRGPLRMMIDSGEIQEYDVLQLVHTLYYINFQDLADALHAPSNNGKRVAYALVHRHELEKGAINDGEQTYEKKYVSGRWLVKQSNVATGSSYVHPCLSQLLFAQRKVWLPPTRTYLRHDGMIGDDAPKCPELGLAWEVHKVNSETWVVEIVPYTDQVLDGVEDFAQEWDDADLLETDDYMSTPSSSEPASIIRKSASIVIPSNDGKFVELDIPCVQLFEDLRLRAMGKPRDAKLLEELISVANHLVKPSVLFGNKPGMRCPPDKIYDVAVAAFAVDIQKEADITASIAGLRPVLVKHARNRKLGPKFKDLSVGGMLDVLRNSLAVAQSVNKAVRSRDPVDAGLEHLQGWLT